MKIFYAIQATGNGHISRANQLMPYLVKYGQVDTFLSGSNSTLNPGFDVKYKSNGLSLFYGACGNVDYQKCFTENYFMKAWKMIKTLPVHEYDLVINDFDFITSRACKYRNVPSVQFGHQASFKSDKVPRPENKSLFGEMVLHHYAPSENYLGLHFKKYDDFIMPPVIKESILNAEPIDLGYISVYLPSVNIDCIYGQLQSLKDINFQWFSHGISEIRKEGNITFFPIENDLFARSLIGCHGLITGGGFETPAEALYLKKKLMTIPINGQYEQMCNAVALRDLGVKAIFDFHHSKMKEYIIDWLNEEDKQINMEANNVSETIEYIVNTYA